MYKTIILADLPELSTKYRKVHDEIVSANENIEVKFIVKGGVSRLTLLEYIIKTGKPINDEGDKIENQTWRMGEEREINDLDLVVLHKNTLPKSREKILEGIASIRSKTFGLGIYIDPSDIEPTRVKNLENYEETINAILLNRDLTINQNLLEFSNGQWLLHYTPQCYRHLVEGIGMLGPKHQGILRLDAGRLLPTSYGLMRLIKFWVEGKIISINLPQRMLDAHINEMEKRDQGLLGNYGRLVAEMNRNSSSSVQERWIRALKSLGLTTSMNFESFYLEQKKLFEKNNTQKFRFYIKTPEEVLDNEISRRKAKENKIKSRKDERDYCIHTYEEVTCRGCQLNCKYENCIHCTSYRKSDKDFPCNVAIIKGHENFIGNQFRYFPKKERR